MVGESESELQNHPRFDVFRPLFTPFFDFHQHQLTTLGDVVIDDYLSQAFLVYSCHRGITLTVNATRQLNAVLHNHYTLRHFACQLGFEELAVPLSGSPTVHEGKPSGASLSLDFLEAQRVQISPHDVAGTSFQFTPLAAGQSSMGHRFSHFIGAVHQCFGADVALQLLARVYGIEDVENVPRLASDLLLRVLESVAPTNVCEALLAAQGLPVRFIGVTRMLPATASEGKEEEPPSTKSSTAAGAPSGSPWTSSEASVIAAKAIRSDLHPFLISGFGAAASAADDLTIDALLSKPEVRQSLAEGPGYDDMVDKWRSRSAALADLQVEPSPVEAIEDGWLKEEEHRQYQHGPAFAMKAPFSLVSSSADTYGLSDPVDGKTIARKKFKKAVRDPLFYDKQSDLRNGIPFSTDGEPLSSFLDRLNHPHGRLFEVTMVVGSSEGKVAGRSIASRYTVARESACKAYLGGVLNDLHRLQQIPQEGR